jgi:hypothetical protein
LSVGGWSVFSFVGLTLVILTLADLRRTGDYARSTQSQLAWAFLMVFFVFTVPIYWLGEAPRRRRVARQQVG